MGFDFRECNYTPYCLIAHILNIAQMGIFDIFFHGNVTNFVSGSRGSAWKLRYTAKMKAMKSFPSRIYFFALILRLFPVLLTGSLGIGLDDMFQYDMLARSIASGNGFRWYAYEDLQRLEAYIDFDLAAIDYDPVRGVVTSFRAPLYPAFLALIYSLAGTGPGRFFAARLVQAGITACMAPLTYKISQELFRGDEKIARRAAWIIAAYPLLLIYPIGLATENLFFVLVLAAFFFLLKIVDSDTPERYAFLSGIFLALTALTRSVILPFSGLAVLWVWFVLKERRSAIIVFLTFSLLITPWIIRNSLLHQRLTGIETSMGYNLYVGYHPESDGSFTIDASLDLLTILDDAERDQVAIEQALDFIKANPERILALALNRLRFFFGLEKRALIYFYSNNLLGYVPLPLLLLAATVLLFPFVLVSTSAVLGASLTRLRAETSLLYILLMIYILPHVLILAEDRFHLAITPFFALLAAKAWTDGLPAFRQRWREKLFGKVAVSLALLMAILLLVSWSLEFIHEWDMIVTLFSSEGNQMYLPY
mgnify:CR=1 FL=1